VALLVTDDGDPSREEAVAVLELAGALAVLRVVDIAENGEQPSAQTGSALKFVRVAPCSQQGLWTRSSASVTDPQSETANARRPGI